MRLPALFNHQQYPLRLQAEMLALGAHSTRPHLSLLMAVIAITTSLGELPRWLQGVWLSWAVLTTVFGFWFKQRYLHADQGLPDPAMLRRGELTGLLYSSCVGMLWGTSSQLLLSGQTEHNLIITLIYLGVCAGAGSIAIFGLGHLLAGSLVSGILFIGHLPQVYPQYWQVLVPMFLIYHVVIVRTALERSAVIAANMRLREEKEQLLELQQQETARAHHASQEKSAFLAAASHDLRQPVHALMLLGHALRLRLPDGENAQLVARMLAAGQALSDQFNNLMDLSRLESGIYPLHPVAVALDSFLRKQCNAHQHLAHSQGIVLRLRCDRRLQQPVLLDIGLLERVVANLLGNALKFSSTGCQVLVSARLQQGGLLLGIHDQGPGIAAEQRERIFQPYVQLGNPTRDRAKGIGLGLSIVQQAAGLLGGTVTLQSQPGHGSHFYLRLPQLLFVTPSPESEAAEPTTSSPPHVSPLQGKRLLLVEDDPMAAAALQTWAEDQGLQVRHLADPRQVSPLPAPDLILCDIRLPGEEDGIYWLTEWLAQWPEARGLLVSGELAAETHQRAEQEGLLLLPKPVNPEVLLQTLAGMLR